MSVAGVDVGGSGVRAVVRSDGGDTRRRLDRAMHVRSAIEPVELADGILEVLRLAVGDGNPPTVICIGMTGYPGLLDDPEPIARRVLEGIGAESVVIASDALTTHVGALGLDPGIVVAAGTGVIVLGTDLREIWNRADGWGHLLGDEGSGAWIGRAGIAAGLRAHDGRSGGSAHLLQAVRETYGPIPVLLDAVYRSPAPAFELARFAPSVAEVARAGDATALAIWAAAAERLAESAVAANAGLDPVYSWGGGLFETGDLLLGPFQQQVLAQDPLARFVAPLGGSLDGAVQLAARPDMLPDTVRVFGR